MIDARRRHLNRLCILALAALAVVFLWRVALLGEVLLPLDALYLMEPWRSESSYPGTGPIWNPTLTDAIWQLVPTGSYAQEAWREGVPFWDPFVMAGLPAFARGDLFSNPIFNLLGLLMPVGHALSWSALIHLLLGSAFTFFLLREMGLAPFGALIGSLAFTYNLYLIVWLSLPIVTGAMLWLPLIFWSAERARRRQDWRWILPGSVGFALQILEGIILWPFYGAITLGLYAVYLGVLRWWEQRSLRALILPSFYSGLLLVLGAALAAPLLLSSIELYLHTGRTGALGGTSFLPWTQLIRLLVPDFYGRPLDGLPYWGPFNYTETSLYFGILPLVFLAASLFSDRRRLAWGLVGIGLVTYLAVYGVFPFKQITSTVYPVFLNTFPGRIFFVTAFVWSLAAALGADWIERERPLRCINLLSAGVATLAVAALLATFWLARYHSLEGQWLGPQAGDFYRVENMRIAGVALLTFWLLAAFLLLRWWGRENAGRGLFISLGTALTVVGLFTAGIRYNSAFDGDLLHPTTPSLELLQALKSSEAEPFRILNINSGTLLTGIAAQYYRLPTISGYTSWVMDRYSQYADLTQSRVGATVNHVYFDDCCHPLINALNVKYLYTSPGVVPSSSGTLSLLNLGTARIHTEESGSVHTTTWLLEGDARRVLYEHPPARVDFDVAVDSAGVLRTAIAIDPSAWDKPGDGTRFQVLIEDQERRQKAVAFSSYIDPKNSTHDRKMFPVEVALNEYVGRHIVLSLATDEGPNGDGAFDWAGWVEPVITGAEEPTLDLVYDGPNKIYRNRGALPRAWIAHRVTEAREGDLAAVKERLGASDFDPRKEAVVEGSLIADLGQGHPDDRVVIISYEAERVEMEARSNAPGWLVMADTMYPGWKAYVDGEEVPILTTNLIMRGLYLEAGRHRILFEYESETFFTGVYLAIGSILLFAAAAFMRSARARTAGPALARP